MSYDFVKVFRSIIHSSIWLESDSTLRVWIFLLATADPEGLVEGSRIGLARAAGVEVEAWDRAIATFTAPDSDSKDPEHEGRRIEAVPGIGWRVLNARKYRDRRSEPESGAERTRRWRERSRGSCDGASHNVTPVTSVTSRDEVRLEGEGDREERQLEKSVSSLDPSLSTSSRRGDGGGDSPTALEFPCNGESSTWKLTVKQVETWAALYPGLDVEAECRKALAWVSSGGAGTRKTARGMPRFLVSWLNRATDRGGGFSGGRRSAAGSRSREQVSQRLAAADDPTRARLEELGRPPGGEKP